jgi:hypothetical protein
VSLKQIVIVIILAILVGGGGALALTKYKTTPKQSPVSENLLASPTEVLIKFITWEDQAGFTFQYPEGLKVDNHPDDNANYANLTITGRDGAGSINILMSDDTYKSIEKWAKADSIDTSLGGINGKKIITNTGETIIGVIDNGVLVTIKKEANLSSILETTWEKIIDTWQFVYPTPTVGKKPVKVLDNQDDDENVLEEE